MRQLLVISGVISMFAFACSHNEGMPDRQMSEMSDTVGKLQMDLDKENHGFMDDGLPSPAAKAAAAAASAKAAGNPPRTVQLEGDVGDGENDDPNDPAARPEIKLQGAGGGVSTRPSTRSSKSSRSNPSPDDSSSTNLNADGPHSSNLDPDAKRAYDNAISLVNSKQYDRALDELTSFLTKWPDHPYAENATYWKGECYYARGEYLRAGEQFESVVNKYGAGKKGADALLKLGMCQDRLGATDRANEYWARLRRDFPHSEAVKKIPQTDTTRRTAGPKESR